MTKALETYRPGVENALAEILERHRSTPRTSKIAEAVYEEICAFVRRPGKRLRPLLLIAAYTAFCPGKKPPLPVFRAGAAMELFHDFLLVHDDVIDRSALRRGLPSLHVLLAKEVGGSDDSQGRSLAIVAGDILCSLAFDTLASSGFGPATANQALRELSHIMQETCFGQCMDIVCARRPFAQVSADAIETIGLLKTAAYTAEGPLVIGAILAETPPKAIAALRAFARPLGKAFQLQDDILGLFGDESSIGKPATSDLAEGKKTLLTHWAMETLPAEDRNLLRSLAESDTPSREDLDRARTLVRKSGALDRVTARKAALAKGAEAILHEMLDPPVAARLAGVANILIDRDR